jgi:predicted nucleic acid-binding protein
VPFPAVLDACVLYPASLRDTLLRCAEGQLFEVVSSARILEEVERNLVGDGRATAVQARRLVTFMHEAFPDAVADAEEIARLEPAMDCDPDDNHIAAAAVAGSAELIVTRNLADFRSRTLQHLGIQVVEPDDLLCEFLATEQRLVIDLLHRQAAALTRPPVTLAQLIGFLEVAVPRFAASLRAAL